MTERRSIQDIVPPARSKPIRNPVQKEEATETQSVQPPQYDRPMNDHNKKPPFLLLGGIAGIIVVLIALFSVVSFIFHRADVSVTLKSFPVSINETFEAAPGGSVLSFTQAATSVTQSAVVPSTGREVVEDRASGTIVVQNAYSTESQRLIANTRFEASDGRIYRIRAPIVIPGYTVRNGEKIPGEIRTTVYADEAGDAYNKMAATFTIPGLKESGQSDMYSLITAKTEDPLTGGFVGERPVISRASREAATTELKNDLDRLARAQLLSEVPEGMFIFADTVEVVFRELPDIYTDNEAKIALEATAQAPQFSETEIATLIASENGISTEGRLILSPRENFTFEVSESNTEGNLSVKMLGEGSVEPYFDQSAFIEDLLGKNQRSVSATMVLYPAISDLKVRVYPFWRQSLPKSSDRFNITTQ